MSRIFTRKDLFDPLVKQQLGHSEAHFSPVIMSPELNTAHLDLSFSFTQLGASAYAYLLYLLRYFCLAVWPSIFATCNRRDKNKLSLPVQYCHFGSIHLTTDVSTKKISVSQYCPNNTLQITSIQLIININHMAARSGSSR